MTYDRRSRRQLQNLASGSHHILPISGGRLKADPALVKCRDCQVSCQSACKTSCTVGNQRCPK